MAGSQEYVTKNRDSLDLVPCIRMMATRRSRRWTAASTTLDCRDSSSIPNTQKFDCGDSRVKEVIGHAGELGVPVIIDSYSPTDKAQSGKIVEAALQHPETALCLAHVGGYSFMDFAVFGFLTQCSGVEHNVYFDLTASYVWFYHTPFQEQFLWMTKQIGKERLLFGTDFPLMGPRDESGVHRRYASKDCIGILRDFGYPDEWLPAILGGNAARLLNIKV